MPDSYAAPGERFVRASRRDNNPSFARPTCTHPYSRISWSYSMSDFRMASATSAGVPNAKQAKSHAKPRQTVASIVHDDRPVPKQRSNSFHDRRRPPQVRNNDFGRSVVESELSRRFGEGKFLQREML